MKITSLLNPTLSDHSGYHSLKPSVPAAVPYSTSQNFIPKRQKVPKDAPIFSEGNKIVGFVNYPPYEAEDDHSLAVEHERFQLYPRGDIYKKGIRHIPYNSDKKDFLDKTGRDAFEMFQYTYKRPGEEKEYVVVWDYNVGLVRMTPFFKSCKYSKTVPAKALNQSPGLKDISYSITGGALVCQGYWMPYQAAKALAATFCYDIRWALTPIFGNNFPSMCLAPKDPSFGKFLIDPAIVRYCTAETNRFRMDGASYRVMTSKLQSPFETPKMRFESPSWKPKAMEQRGTQPADVNSESEYGTDSQKYDKFAFSPHISPQWTHLNRPLSPKSLSPQVSPRSQWTALNRTRSPPATPSTMSSALSSPVKAQALPLLQMPTPTPEDNCTEQFRTKRTHSKVAFNDACDVDTRVRPQTASAINSGYGGLEDGEKVVNAHTKNEIEAAGLLLSLGAGGSSMLLPPTKRTRRGSTM